MAVVCRVRTVAPHNLRVSYAFEAVIGQDFIEGLELAKSFTHFRPATVRAWRVFLCDYLLPKSR